MAHVHTGVIHMTVIHADLCVDDVCCKIRLAFFVDKVGNGGSRSSLDSAAPEEEGKAQQRIIPSGPGTPA
jgi:hypothetical protein